MAARKRSIGGALSWPVRQLRFLLIWPLIVAWRRKTRRSLRWRLAASHFAVVLYSVLAIAAVGIAGMVVLAYVQVPTQNEAAAEASVVAKSFERLATKTSLTDADRSSILRALATGELAPNLNQSNIAVYANVGRVLGHVKEISIVDRSGTIVASSDPNLIAKPLATAGPLPATVGARPLRIDRPRLQLGDRSHDAGTDRGLPVARLEQRAHGRGGRREVRAHL